MALTFDPQERGSFAAPRMPNATWGGLVQGYRNMQSPLEAIGMGLDQSARISNQQKLMDRIGSGKIDLSNPGKAYQQAMPLLNRTTENAVNTFGNLLTNTMKAREEKRLQDSAQLMRDQFAQQKLRDQWGRERDLANLGFRNLQEARAEKQLSDQMKTNALSRLLTQAQINKANKPEKPKMSMYVDPQTGKRFWLSEDEALSARSQGANIMPMGAYQNAEQFNQSHPVTQARTKRAADFIAKPTAEKRREYEKSLEDRNLFWDVDLSQEQVDQLNKIESLLTPQEINYYSTLSPAAKMEYLLNRAGYELKEKNWFEQLWPFGSDYEFRPKKGK